MVSDFLFGSINFTVHISLDKGSNFDCLRHNVSVKREITLTKIVSLHQKFI